MLVKGTLVSPGVIWEIDWLVMHICFTMERAANFSLCKYTTLCHDELNMLNILFCFNYFNSYIWIHIISLPITYFRYYIYHYIAYNLKHLYMYIYSADKAPQMRTNLAVSGYWWSSCHVWGSAWHLCQYQRPAAAFINPVMDMEVMLTLPMQTM